MCLGCGKDLSWDNIYIDRAINLVETRPECDGQLVPFMSFEEVKDHCMKEWLQTKNTAYRVYKDGVIDLEFDTCSWTIPKQKTELSIKFV